jgi:hypothetical protein
MVEGDIDDDLQKALALSMQVCMDCTNKTRDKRELV